jgi:hypothetical protein
MQPDTWLVSRELTDAAGPWNTQLWRDNDGEYFCRVVLASNSIRFTPEAKSYYRKSGSTSISFIGRSAKKQDSLFLSLKLHAGYLRSLEDSERTRKACVSYLQTWFHNFYPERADLISQLQQLAELLGGKLEAPRLSWKYAWIQKGFGWTAAKQAQLAARTYKENLLRSWDKTMFQLENAKRLS